METLLPLHGWEPWARLEKSLNRSFSSLPISRKRARDPPDNGGVWGLCCHRESERMCGKGRLCCSHLGYYWTVQRGSVKISCHQIFLQNYVPHVAEKFCLLKKKLRKNQHLLIFVYFRKNGKMTIFVSTLAAHQQLISQSWYTHWSKSLYADFCPRKVTLPNRINSVPWTNAVIPTPYHECTQLVKKVLKLNESDLTESTLCMHWWYGVSVAVFIHNTELMRFETRLVWYRKVIRHNG